MSETKNERIERIKGAHELGLAFVKTLILINSGACVVLMTYMGNANNASAFGVPLPAVKWSLAAFLVGILSILSALGYSYFYTALHPSVKKKQSMDGLVIPFNTVCGLISLLAFVVGVIILIVCAEINVFDP
jgi:uncharacterized membrane protein YidH (DUF202 family)